MGIIYFIKDSILCPVNNFPCLFTVAEIEIGNFTFFSSKTSSVASSAAFAVKPSKIVSSKIPSTPPSISPATWTFITSFISSKLTALLKGTSPTGKDKQRDRKSVV